ncbi:hypothetical protein VTP01DRAFT_2922, partial [Rhizomucor pusillus]|uniref:uncharacterized protein n=1 Tax=Rhizomucor pusillus TaxID=4840 RepID=UPI0037423042
MEQQTNHTLSQKENQNFQPFAVVLEGTLDHSLDCIDHIDGLSDYHVNCIKPFYSVQPYERTPFVEYIIPVFKYFSASTGLFSFIW